MAKTEPTAAARRRAREPKVPPPWEKLARAESLKLLAVEQRTLVTARSDMHAIAGHVHVELARKQDHSHEALLALLLLARDRMGRRVAKRIREGRMQARLSAIGRLRAELLLGGVALAVTHSLVPRTKTDAAHADVAGASLAAAWASGALYHTAAVTRTADTGAGEPPLRALGRAIDDATEAVDARLQRFAATEIPHAYNDQHRDDAVELAETDTGFASIWVRQWDARLDACPLCWSLDGETTFIGGEFRGGYEPGYVHPFCRCQDSLVPRTLH